MNGSEMSVGEDVACVTAAAAHTAQQLPQRLHQPRFPDEIDRVDAVRLPELEVSQGDRQPVLLGDQPTVCPDHDSKWLTRRTGRHAERGGIGEGLLHVLAENPLDIFRQREVLAAFGQHALVQVDDVRAEGGEIGGCDLHAARRSTGDLTGPAEHDGLVGFRQLGRGGGFGGRRIGQEDIDGVGDLRALQARQLVVAVHG